MERESVGQESNGIGLDRKSNLESLKNEEIQRQEAEKAVAKREQEQDVNCRVESRLNGMELDILSPLRGSHPYKTYRFVPEAGGYVETTKFPLKGDRQGRTDMQVAQDMGLEILKGESDQENQAA